MLSCSFFPPHRTWAKSCYGAARVALLYMRLTRFHCFIFTSKRETRILLWRTSFCLQLATHCSMRSSAIALPLLIFLIVLMVKMFRQLLPRSVISKLYPSKTFQWNMLVVVRWQINGAFNRCNYAKDDFCWGKRMKGKKVGILKLSNKT